MTVLKSRPIPGGVAEAVAGFDRFDCGFIGMVDWYANTLAITPAFVNAQPDDHIVVVRNGRVVSSKFAQDCLSDTVPRVSMKHGVIVVTLWCDRLSRWPT